MIVLNEREYIEDVMSKNIISNKPSETINLMAKYYKSRGMKRKECFNRIDEYFTRNYKSYNKIKWETVINKYIRDAYDKKYTLIEIDKVPITKKEMEVVRKIDNKRLERLIFTMLVIAKFNNLVNPKNNGWVNREDKEVFKIANIRVGKKDQCLLINDLKARELIEFSNKVDNVNSKIKFIKEDDGDVELEITDMRDLGFLYSEYIGDGKFRKCVVCGKMFKQNFKSPQIYCDVCCKIKELERHVKYNMKR